ncbi:helix-hairpin-helix domain-containing protein [Algoriphagus halophytocola]|uniref:Helix-hairpin-helix domain-containing protein n=1 Tax=Algoriphagus halophytocola TaxID=2991499 RepID=A0ABY6MGE3_9BACT|nr:helix-hairpin-helix domain-containing protein [Algoriphagus sp. TR-M5]UZD21706.1 helix-hairpin-helix domain-containing protein [Algoriphagus sp. TR-M5]
MSKDCNDLTLPGNGSSRAQRLLKSLLPEYVRVDERKMEDLQDFAVNIASQLKFINSSNTWNGDDWSGFFDQKIEENQLTNPHFALFLAFLKLFSFAQEDINTLTQRHLDFYYRDVLRLKEKPAVDDQVYLILKLAKHIQAHLLPANTAFKAGKDDLGKEILFQTANQNVLNKAEVTSLLALYKDQNGRFYKSPIASSADGIGGELLSEEKQWRSFGRPTELFPDQDRELATIGFAVASPILLMGEGSRKVSLKLTFEPTEGLLDQLKLLPLNDTFEIWFSGEEEWISASIGWENEENSIASKILDFLNKASKWQDIAGVEPVLGPVLDDPEKGTHRPFNGYDIGEITAKNILSRRNSLSGGKFTSVDQVKTVRGIGEDKWHDLEYTFRLSKHELSNDGDGISLTLKCQLLPEDPAVVNYSEEALLQKFKTSSPMMKINLANTSQSYGYEILKDCQLKKATLSIDVEGIENLILQNDQSILPIGKNIKPFGFRPVKGSNFYIGSKEVFGKSLKSLDLNLLWHALPEDSKGFADHYSAYGNTLERKNQSFTTAIDFLEKKEWKSINSSKTIFSGNDNASLNQNKTISLAEPLWEGISANPNLEEFSEWSPASNRGFIRLKLNSPDFGHKDYPLIFAREALVPDGKGNLPNEPYTPELQSVSLDYTSEETLDISSKDLEGFFHVGAFGEAKVEGENAIPLLAEYENEGELMIGLSDHQKAQNIQLLIQVLDGTANPEKPVPDVKWSYLTGNQWKEFDQYSLLTDETNGLIQSGLLAFAMPREAGTSHTILPESTTWIKASVRADSDAIPDFIAVLAQAVKASYESNENDPLRVAKSISAETISKLKIGNSAINKIQQPFSSFGGKTEESSEDFYQRISERLRHKQRAITLWDYEHLVLEQFPEVYQVKCLNHTSYDGDLTKYKALAPRNVTLVIISNVQNKNAVDPLRPKASVAQIEAIREFITAIYPPAVYLHVVNPVFEEIQVKTKVKFHSWADKNFFARKLEDDLKAFLSPWAFEADFNWTFSESLHSSVVLHFVEKLDYVDYLTCFELYHLVINPVSGELLSRTRVEAAKGSRGVSVLGSVGTLGSYGDHLIEVLETEDCLCEDNEIKPAASIASVEEEDLDEEF